MKAYKDRLELLKHSEELSRHLVFEQKLLTLLNHYSMGFEHVMSFIPRTVQQSMRPPGKRKAGRPRKA
ncbi:hypothetical protein [Pseudomonas sp. 3A(2025)]